MQKMPPKLKEFVDETNRKMALMIERPPLPEFRQMLEEFSHQLGGEKPEISSVVDIEISHRQRARLYMDEKQEEMPLIVFFFGGGFVRGSIESHDVMARYMAKITRWAVLLPDYRLSPEHPFPSPLEDAENAMNWVLQNIEEYRFNPLKIAVSGSSAGGYLAAHMAKTYGLNLYAQILLCPWLDMTLGSSSMKEYESGYLLEAKGMEYYRDQFLPREFDPHDPMISPVFDKEVSRIPRTLVVTAELDPLKDDGETYVQNLREGNRAVEHVEFKGMVHSFAWMFALINEPHILMTTIRDFLR